MTGVKSHACRGKANQSPTGVSTSVRVLKDKKWPYSNRDIYIFKFCLISQTLATFEDSQIWRLVSLQPKETGETAVLWDIQPKCKSTERNHSTWCLLCAVGDNFCSPCCVNNTCNRKKETSSPLAATSCEEDRTDFCFTPHYHTCGHVLHLVDPMHLCSSVFGC